MPETKRPLKVFLCHAHSDATTVRGLYSRLRREGVDVWLDKEKLLPGSDWELEIRKAVREADVVVVCLSKQFNQAGFRQKEVRIALDTAMEQPEGEIFIIPARLEECENLESLTKWHWVDLFETDGYQKLIRALRIRADRIGATLRIRRGGATTAPRLTSNEVEANAKGEQEAARVNARATHLQAEELARQKAAKEKVAREKAEREVAERIAQEKVVREKAEQEAKEQARIEKEQIEKRRLPYYETLPLEKPVHEELKAEKTLPKKTKPPRKPNTAIIVASIGLVGTIAAALLSSPLIENWLSPAPVATEIESVTPTFTLTVQPVTPSNTIEPSQNESFVPTISPLPTANEESRFINWNGEAVSWPESVITTDNGNQIDLLVEKPLDASTVYWLVGELDISPDDQYIAFGLGANSYLVDFLDSSVRDVFVRNNNSVKCIAFSPNGNLLLTASEESKNNFSEGVNIGQISGDIRAWDINSGSLIFAINGQVDPCGIVTSPDGNAFASSSLGRIVQLWKIPDGTELLSLDHSGGNQWGIDISPDGSLLAAGGADNQTLIWSIADGTIVKSFQGGGSDIKFVRFSPNGELVASQDNQGFIRIHIVSNGTLLSSFQGGDDYSYQDSNFLYFSQDGDLLFVGSRWSSNIEIWDISEKSLVKKIDLPAYVLNGFSITHDGKLLVTLSSPYEGAPKLEIFGIP